ncbi:hypothetical protein OIU85_003123 [Salix viminalis]|uniref:BHLH domain-containing protein n=1 Tax=Salix viminalis TaxID=40686 RepID=A0A9Q0PYZ6_SALVM|nr:hypothetical protein OIU85_003123 [Salix viminalis]
MENKRSPCSVDHGTLTSLATKRHKPDFSVSTKERKENLGERIVALQQLVSPYGKTDTASVLMEAMEYIRFLHEQVQVWTFGLLLLIFCPAHYSVSLPVLEVILQSGNAFTGWTLNEMEISKVKPCAYKMREFFPLKHLTCKM